MDLKDYEALTVGAIVTIDESYWKLSYVYISPPVWKDDDFEVLAISSRSEWVSFRRLKGDGATGTISYKWLNIKQDLTIPKSTKELSDEWK